MLVIHFYTGKNLMNSKLSKQEEDSYFWVTWEDEKETLENLGFKTSKDSVLEYDPYQQEGWDD